MKKLKVDTSWTLFLDRDGVINERNFHGYITHPKEFVFCENVKETLPLLNTFFKHAIVITNQQGVAKGIMSESNLEQVHRYMLESIEKSGGKIDKIYSAINLKGADDDRRKPKTNMALEAKNDFPEIDFLKSIMVGDTNSDILFGKKNGMKTVLIRSKENITEVADFEIDSLDELLDLITYYEV